MCPSRGIERPSRSQQVLIIYKGEKPGRTGRRYISCSPDGCPHKIIGLPRPSLGATMSWERRTSCQVTAFPPILHPSTVAVLTKALPEGESVSLPSFTKTTCKGCLRASIRAYAGRVDRWRRIDVHPAVRGIVHSAPAPVEAEVIETSANQHMPSRSYQQPSQDYRAIPIALCTSHRPLTRPCCHVHTEDGRGPRIEF